jgi:hypothetical protein
MECTTKYIIIYRKNKGGSIGNIVSTGSSPNTTSTTTTLPYRTYLHLMLELDNLEWMISNEEYRRVVTTIESHGE